MTDLIAIATLHERHHGVTEHISGVYAEAAAVCFSRHHSPPAQLVTWCNERVNSLRVRWLPPGDRVRAAWANELDTTEFAAYGVALAVVETELGLVAVSRARTLTGADYYVAAPNETDYLENAYKLEVSGIDHGGMAEIKARLRKKLVQVSGTVRQSGALACVVAFKALIVLVRQT